MPILKSFLVAKPAGLLCSDQKSDNATEHFPSELVLPPTEFVMSHAYKSMVTNSNNKFVKAIRFIIVGLWLVQN